MSALATEDICTVSAADIYPVSTADICPVSTEDIYPVSTEDATAAGLRPAAVIPESSGSAWACGVFSGAPRRGLTRGEESEEGGSVDYHMRALPQHPLRFRCFLGV